MLDFLTIYNGNNQTNILEQTLCGEVGEDPSEFNSLLQPGDVFTSTAADGCLTFVFDSDGSETHQGWAASVSIVVIPGCTDGIACNYNPNATTDDGSCDYGNFDCSTDPCNPVFGCTEANACNYDPGACFEDGSCVYGGCRDASACNYDPAAQCDDGFCDYGVEGCPDPCSAFLGCTDFNACNYDGSATCDDGSCIYGLVGCTNPLACNYNPSATCDDGNCETELSTLRIEMSTDDYPAEINWTLSNPIDGAIILESPQYSTATTTGMNYCLEKDNCYVFEITDSQADGICCEWGEGEYKLFLDNLELRTGSSYGSGEQFTFCTDGNYCIVDLVDRGTIVSDVSAVNNIVSEGVVQFGNITYEGSFIDLIPGFEVMEGAGFRAEIESCSFVTKPEGNSKNK